MFKDLRLKARILLGYSVPVLLFVLVAIIVYANIRIAKEQLNLEYKSHKIVQDIKDWELSIEKMQRSARGYLISKNDVSRKNFEWEKEDYEKLSQAISNSEDDPEHVAELKNIIEIGTRLGNLNKELIALVDKGRQDKALQLFRTEGGFKISRELGAKLRDHAKEEAGRLKIAEKASHSALNSVVLAVVFGTILSIILSIAIGFLIAGRIGINISRTVNALSATSTEIAATVTQHEYTASQQASMVNETTTTIQELGVSSRQTSEQASSAAEVAQRASKLTGEGTVTVKQAIDGMNSLGENVGMVAGQILKLGEQTARIGNLANIVKDLSGEINMLALNAAVEAARAGEHGKGFAVVAGEVRKLANESKKSAEQANTIIADIQKATNATIIRTEEGTKVVEEVTGYARNVGELFNTLSEAANTVYENAQQVLLNANQQSTAIGQVVEAMNGLNTGARETAAGIIQTKAGLEQLNNAAENLKRMV